MEELVKEQSPLLEVRNLHLVLQAEIYRKASFRDYFARAFQDPVASLLDENDRLHILQGISFRVARGDRLGILGVNGTGKTSLCRCLAGIYRPTSGAIVRRASVRAIFDTAVGIQPELTGRENAYLLAEFMYPKEYRRHAQIVEEALEFSELGKFLDMPYRLYSNGMQARLCLSLISAQPAEVLVLDEVFDGADKFFREKISARILNVIQRSGAALFVSHSKEQVQAVCNRVIIIHQGKLRFDGPVDKGIQLYDQLGKGV